MKFFLRQLGLVHVPGFVLLALASLAAASISIIPTPSAHAAQGGGYTLAGLVGEYFANPTFTPPVAFTRRDVRIDFGSNSLPPGGGGQVGDLRFRSVAAEGFSVRWTGQILPRFSETYSFKGIASGALRLRLRPSPGTDWSTVIDAASGGTNSGSFAFTSGTACEIEITFAHATGPWNARLLWASPSTPEEVIDPPVQSGINNPDWTAGFTDIVKGARNSWEPVNNGTRPPMDADGWPLGDGAYVYQESLNQGLDVDPLMRGKVSFSFKGKATVSVQGNVLNGSLLSQYNAASNVTTGSVTVRNNGWNATYIRFANTDRDGVAGGQAGITDFRLMRPTAPDATSSYSAETSLFTQQLLDAMAHFTVIRHQYVANQQRDWDERTRPTFFNQNGGMTSTPHYGIGGNSDNGASWEHKVLLANESGRDMMISLPPVASGRTPADTSSYLYKLANLIRYGSDGKDPYTAPNTAPIYPPLNPNLRVYLEIGNELWNWGGVFYTDFANINALAAADADANNDDFKILNFDGLSTAKDGGGSYTSMNTWRYRKIMLRLIQISDIFRSVFGDDAMMARVRPLYEWQYDNANDTARLALTFVDRYFNNGDGQQHVPTPHPISHWLWGAGGAAYYGAVNGNGLNSILPNSDFAIPTLPSAGYQATPTGASWGFSGTAGIARDGGSNDDIPPAFHGSQVGYITDRGVATATVTFPTTNVTSPVFAVSFKAVNRTRNGASAADKENLRVYLDGTTDITARTFSQGNGYTPPAFDPGSPWTANNVFWTRSEYYATKSFSVTPGSTHTISFKGQGDISNASATDQTTFLGEVRVTAVDRIFEDGMPGGGEAAGQPIGQNIRRVMNVEASWAKAFGLEQLSYESGWSLGGDDGGSWLQLRAKYGDSRTAEVQGRFMDYFHRAGSAVNVFGTYAQWPSWADFYAEQGLLDVAKYPIVQGIDNRARSLPPEADNGTVTPAVLGTAQATLGDNADLTLGRISNAGGWITWNIVANRSGNNTITLGLGSTNTPVVLLLDNLEVASGAGPADIIASNVWTTKGFHSLKVRSISTSASPAVVKRIAISGTGAPSSPASLSVQDGDGRATLTWTPVPGAGSYQVRYGTTPGAYTAILDAGSGTNLVVSGLVNNQQYFFAVLASNASGDSLPSMERGAIPLGPGQTGRLAIWEFNGATGGETSAASASSSSKIITTPLTRGSGLIPSDSTWAAGFRANRFGSEPSTSASHAYGANLAGAISKNQQYQFTISPVKGQSLSLGSVSFRAMFQGGTGGAGISWSTDGTHFSTGLIATGSASTSANAWGVDLSGQAALQGVTTPVTLRIYLYGLGAYQVSGLGDASGDDIVVTGALTPIEARLSIAPTEPGGISISWPTNLATFRLETATELSTAPSTVWNRVATPPQQQGGQWTLAMPFDSAARFFRLSE